MKKRYSNSCFLFIHIRDDPYNVYALPHAQELAFNEEENDRNKQVPFFISVLLISVL